MNSTAITTTRETGLASFEAGHSILGETSIRIPISGKIRPGIMVLTADGKKLKEAEDIYAEGVRDGRSWDAIENAIRRVNPEFKKSPLTPKNAPYFSVFPHDFGMPEVADIIMKKYGEDRGEGLRLYRFPIVFGFDLLEQVLPHQFAMHSRRELKYWSEYDAMGVRHCMTREPVPVDPKSQRAGKVFGGRKSVMRRDNMGVCNPDVCPQYQSGECKLKGQLVAYIPGVPGVGQVAIPTTSIYSLKRIRDKLAIVFNLRKGRISGTVNAKPIFWVTKREEEVSMINPQNGLPMKVKQWLVVLEEDVDMTAVMISHEAPALIREGGAAADVLEHQPVEAEPAAEPVKAEPVKGSQAPTAAELRTEIEKHLLEAKVKKATFGRWAMSVHGHDYRDNVEALSSLVDSAIALKEDDGLRTVVMSFEEVDRL